MKHGESIGSRSSKEHRAWIAMRARCYCRTNHAYSHYGGRGIKICDRWLYSFQNFLDDIGRAPSPTHTLERIDNSKGYYPENCKWATRKEQMNNTRRTKLIKYAGKTMSLKQWCEYLGLKYYATKYRLFKKKLPVNEVLNKPNYENQINNSVRV